MKELEEYVRTMTSKGQVTIPIEIRRLLEMEPGDKVIFRVTEDAVELHPVTMSLEDTFGAVTPQNRPEDFDKLREIAIKEHIEKTIAKRED